MLIELLPSQSVVLGSGPPTNNARQNMAAEGGDTGGGKGQVEGNPQTEEG